MNQPLIDNQLAARPLPSCFPRRLRRAVAGKRIHFRLHGAIRERMQVPEAISVSEYAERHRHVTAIDAHPGRWRNEMVPHTVAAMDDISKPWVRQLWLCWPERAGKTQVILNGAMWQIDRGVDSGSIFWLMPTENEVKKALGERIIDVLKASPRTRRLLSDYADDTTRSIIRFRHGPRLFPAWSNSAASVSSFFGRLNIADEIDKFDTSGVGKETDILTLFFKRGRDRADSKFLFASTPAQGYIYKGANGCQQVWEYRSKCPECGELVTMDEEHVVIPVDATAEQCAHGLVPISYACNACGSEWNESDRAQAYRLGDWVCIKGENEKYPVSIGRLLSAFSLPNIPLTEIAEKIVKAKHGTETDKKALANGYKCIDYEPEVKDRHDDHIMILRDDRPVGLVPSAPIAAISVVADMQKRGFWYTVRAWAYGLEQESWLLQHGYLDSWTALENIFFKSEFRDVAGRVYMPNLWAMDSGGGESEGDSDLSRTAEAYLFACKHPEVLLFKGNSRMTQMVSRMIIDKIPGTNKQLPGAPTGYNVNAKIYKNRLGAKLMINPADPGAWHIHSGLTREEVQLGTPMSTGKDNLLQFARQMCAETLIDGNWQNPGRKANHLWDCSYMELALVDIAQVKYWQLQDTEPEPPKQASNDNGNQTKSRRW